MFGAVSTGPAAYHFVPFDSPQRRLHRGAQPQSQKYLTGARQHVMRRYLDAKSNSCTLVSANHGSKQVSHNQGSNTDKQYKASQGTDNTSPENFSLELDTMQYAVPAPRLCRTKIDVMSNSPLDSFTRYPVQATGRMQYLFDYISRTDCRTIRPFFTSSRVLLHLDVGLFYQTLAVSAFCPSTRSSPAQRKLLACEGLGYYIKGLNYTNSQLTRMVRAEIAGLLVSIMGIAVHTLGAGWCWETTPLSPQKTKYDDCEWTKHFSALKIILDGNGGVRSIEKNSALRFWIYAMDIEGALPRDVPPFFPLTLPLLPDIITSRAFTGSVIETTITFWRLQFPTQQVLFDVYQDLHHTMVWMSESALHDANFWNHPPTLAHRLMPILHRCLQLSEYVGSPEAHLLEQDGIHKRDQVHAAALRHGIILSIAPVRRRFATPSDGFNLHISKLIVALELCFECARSESTVCLFLWALVMGGMEAYSCDHKGDWFASAIVACCRLAGKASFREARSFVHLAVTRLVWLGEVMNSPFASLMRRVQQHWELIDVEDSSILEDASMHASLGKEVAFPSEERSYEDYLVSHLALKRPQSEL